MTDTSKPEAASAATSVATGATNPSVLPAAAPTPLASSTAAPVGPPTTFSWMNKTRQWGTRVKPNKKGLTLGALNVGVYGDIPDQWEDQTRMPRGSVGRPGVPPIGYSIRAKKELWAESAADLYEEAIQRRWIPARDVPWASIEPLPDDVEAAMCQICTELCQYANTEIEAISLWQDHMSYGYHEVKMFLATNSFDCARMYEAFRKRALVNGGGMGLENKGDVNRMILESRGGWTETVSYLQLMRGTFTLNLLRHGHAFAHNDAERVIFAHCMQDTSRHLVYALDHLRYAVAHQEDQALILQTFLTVGESIFARELKDPALREALAIVYGGGIEGARGEGMTKAVGVFKAWVNHYLECCEYIGVPQRATLHPGLAKYLA